MCESTFGIFNLKYKVNFICLLSAHLWQLIFIALQSVTNPTSIEKETTIPSSPSKTLRKRALSPDAVILAQRLLISYAETNQPSTVARCLPSYDSSSAYASETPPSDLIDSAIGEESMCIPKSRHCWSMLAPGFTSAKAMAGIRTTEKNSTRRLSEAPEFESTFRDQVIGADAWPILAWLLLLFERDERTSENGGKSGLIAIRYACV
jgi:hypothetical protein